MYFSLWLCCIFDHYGYTHPDYNTWTHLTWYSQDRVLQWLQALHANIYPGAAWSHVTSYRQEDQSVLSLTRKTIYETRVHEVPVLENSQVAVPPTITTSTAPSPEFLRVTGHTISPVPIIAPLTAMSEMLSSASLDPLQGIQTFKTSLKKSRTTTKGRKEKVKCLQSKNPLKVKFKFQCPYSFSSALQTLATKARKRKLVASHSTIRQPTGTKCSTSDEDESPPALLIDEGLSPSTQKPSITLTQQLATST